MPVNHRFNHDDDINNTEKLMLEDHIVELIQIQGRDVYYLPRERVEDIDTLFGENVHSYFSRAYIMEMYPNNTDGWQGASDFFNRFGMVHQDNCSFVVARRTFEKIVPTNVCIRPREGDLIYVPVMQKIFEITFVDEEKLFFAKGGRIPYCYEITCEAFRSSNERLITSVPEIDMIDDLTSWTVTLNVTGVGSYNKGEKVYQGANLAYSTAQAKVSDWQKANNSVILTEIIGKFEPGSNLIGVSSNTSRLIANTDTMEDAAYYDLYDNKIIQTEANTIINLDETNPFGAP
jgi:hypothetical protein